MQKFLFTTIAVWILVTGCNKPKSKDDKPESKDDYIPINSALVPHTVSKGEPIVSRVNCGFYNYFADIRFLDFEVKENTPQHYDIKARAHYSNIIYGITLEVVNTFDTTLTLPVSPAGQYILKFYDPINLVETDTVMVQ